MAGKPLLSFDPILISGQCKPLPWLTILVASIGGLAGLVLFTALMFYRFRWQIRLRIFYIKHYLRGNRPHLANGYQPIEGDNTLYDAYISVCDSAEDRDWVEEFLLPKMDNGHVQLEDMVFQGEFKLCYDQIHMRPGSGYHEAAEAMVASKKIILVISHDYLKSNRHRNYDIELALELMSQRGPHYIILVLRDIDVDVHVPDSLHPLMQDRLPVWSNEDQLAQEYFWKRLEEKLRYQTQPVNQHVQV